MTRTLFFAAALLIGAGRAHAGELEVFCDLDVQVRAEIDVLDLYQEVSPPRLACAAGQEGSGTEVRVVRYVFGGAEVEVSASAEAEGTIEAEYAGGGDCADTDVLADQCSGTGSDSVGDAITDEVEVVVASVPAESLGERGFSLAPGSCAIQDDKGKTLPEDKAVALVTWLYGERELKKAGGDPSAGKRKPKSAKPQKLPSKKGVRFD